MRINTTARTAVAGVAGVAGVAVLVGAGLAVAPASGLMAPGTGGKDVHIGTDNDNADNPFIQPPGVAAKQHMDNTDVLIGRGNDDLLIGNLGSDTLLGNSGDDILVGGPEAFQAPNSDVMLGERGDDINIWAPGDGSDAFVGAGGHDTMIFAPLETKADGSPKLVRKQHRKIPRVKIDGLPQFSCTIVKVPASQHLGFDFLIRFNVNDAPAVTVRQEAVERVFCPSPHAGHVLVADLAKANPTFKSRKLAKVPGVVGAIMAPTS